MSAKSEPTTQQIKNIKYLNELSGYMTRLEHLTFLMAAGITPTTHLFVMRWDTFWGASHNFSEKMVLISTGQKMSQK